MWAYKTILSTCLTREGWLPNSTISSLFYSLSEIYKYRQCIEHVIFQYTKTSNENEKEKMKERERTKKKTILNDKCDKWKGMWEWVHKDKLLTHFDLYLHQNSMTFTWSYKSKHGNYISFYLFSLLPIWNIK